MKKMIVWFSFLKKFQLIELILNFSSEYNSILVELKMKYYRLYNTVDMEYDTLNEIDPPLTTRD